MKLMATIVGSTSGSSDVNHEYLKLQENLENSVKLCQDRFGARAELATELDQHVVALCQSLEAVLSHGLRPKLNSARNGSVFQQVTALMKELSTKEDNLVFWHSVSSMLTKHEVERYTALKHIWTDIGRGRAWLRSALNEHSLERFLSSFLSNQECLQAFYQDDAYIRNTELSSGLLNTAAGLVPILFAINIDNADLNSSVSKNSRFGKRTDSEPIIISDPGNVNKLKERRKKAKNHIISFDDDNGGDNHIGSVSSISPSASCENSAPICPIITSVPVSTIESVETEIVAALENGAEAAEDAALMEEYCASSPQDKIINSSDNSLRPLDNVGPDKLIPVSSSCLLQFSHNLNDVMEETKSIDFHNDDDFSEEDRLIEENKDLNAQLESLSTLKVDNQKLMTENEMLKHQLCNYVNAVRMLEKEEHNHSDEARLYEQKLVQVAEMHGELMELNSRLQRTLAVKDELIKRLSEELTLLRGPLPPTDDMLAPSSLVNLWIPSAFLTGNVTDQHHVYQIHVRAGEDEWNVYRRYAQFYALCLELKKKYPPISYFRFPPKKTLHKKRASLVDKRRGELETWLRQVVTHLLSTDPLLSSKHNLTIAVPFLGEHFNSWTSKKTCSPFSRNSDDTSSIASIPQYMGL